jgi:lipoate-protein ligase A
MNFLDLTLPTPAENLACDEALLDWREESGGDEILRFWESPAVFVVLGYANKVAAETNVEACKANSIPVLRRCTGGGTVLQGQGVLNYSLILKIEEGTPTASINSANRFIMERNRAALETVLNSQLSTLNSQLTVQGHTDLALATQHSALITHKKFSGNAQRRKKDFLLFHGTFLLKFDISLAEKFLAMPSLQPAYRLHRSHADFIMNLSVPAETVKRELRAAWNADVPLQNVPHERIQLLLRDKYMTDRWNFKF